MLINNVKIKRDTNYLWEGFLMNLSKPFVSLLLKTAITPNMITFFNIIVIIPLILFGIWEKKFILVSILIQIYALVDILDGTVARNKNLASEFGKKLDCFCDDIFYFIVYAVLCYNCRMGIVFSILFVVIVKVYGIIATRFIVKKMKNNDSFRHTQLKQFFKKHHLIFGMDVSFQNLITSVSLILGWYRFSFYIIAILWICDLVYRLYEVTLYQKKL